jgi:hypothetical protein
MANGVEPQRLFWKGDNRPTVRSLREATPAHPNGLQQRKREQAIAALLASGSIHDAAASVQIGYRTLERWLSQPDFQEDYRKAQEQMLDTAVNVLRRASTTFATTLVTVCEDDSVPPVVRLAAAARGLDILMRIHGKAALERELDELEQAVARLESETR